MRFLRLVILLCICLPARGQYNPRKYHAFDDVKKLAYQDNFNTKRLLPLNVTTGSICATGHVQDGVLQLLNNCREPIYTSMDLPVLYKGNFEIVAEVKIFCGETKEMLRDGFISWAVDSLLNTYNTFSFTSDKYYSFRSSDGESGVKRNKQYTIRDVYYYNTFARYTIRKYMDKYYFFINGRLIGTAPYIYTGGKLLELGAAPKAYTLYKLLAVYYLP
jgi:hypothetical protein